MELFYQALMIAACTYVIWKTCDSFQTASLFLGRNMSAGTRGATINAAVSSFPELIVSLIAIFHYARDNGGAFGVFNVTGSLIYNITIIPAAMIAGCLLAGNIKKFRLPRRLVLRDIGYNLVAFALLMIMMAKGFLTFTDSVLLMGVYVFYAVWILNYPKKVEDSGKRPAKYLVNKGPKNIVKSLLDLDLYRLFFWHKRENSTTAAVCVLALDVAIFYFTCEVLVASSYAISSILSIPSFLIAFVITAAATSIPDTLISVKDARIGRFDDAITQAIGTNIFNVSFCIGMPFMLYQLWYGLIDIDASINGEAMWQMMPIAAVLLVPAILIIGKNWRTKMLLLVAAYIGVLYFALGELGGLGLTF